MGSECIQDHLPGIEQGGCRWLVIGGGGFLGQHIVEELLNRGYAVSVFDMRTTFDDDRVRFFVGDLCKQEDMLPALEGVHVVIHCATPSPLSNDRDLFHKVNHKGTINILHCCQEAGVQRLVVTSSALVVYEGSDVVNGSEDMPYASKPFNDYIETKILQEKVVREANNEDFYTVVIRPHGIFGPRDPYVVPNTVRAARSGMFKFIFGNGENLVDFTYVKNVVHGHILAAEMLGPGSKVNGKAYHITNDEPIHFWSFLSRILVGLGYAAPTARLPVSLIFTVSYLLHVLSILLRPVTELQTSLKPITVYLASTHQYYSCEAAKRDIGYRPIVTVDKGLEETLASFSHLKNEDS